MPDPYFDFTLAHPNTPPLVKSLGFLDQGGLGAATFDLPGGLDPALAGIVLHHAALIFDVPGTGDLLLASQAEPVTLAP